MSRRVFGATLLVACATFGVAWSTGCGGSSSSPTSPSTPPPVTGGGAGGSVTISIVGNKGAQSFNPNPANVANGSTFVWTNNDGVTHHIVFNDGSMDSGNLAPGATSAVMTLRTDGAHYYCTIHPTMVGSINTAAGTAPPCTGPYCDSTK